VTTFTYDFRDRQIATDGEEDFYQEQVYDNLNQVIRVDRRDGSSGGNLVARGEADFDDRGRVYRTRTFAVDPATGMVGNSLVDNTWYDASGNTLCSLPAGSQAFTKMTYDGIGRTTASYIGYNPDDEITPDSVEEDLIFQQTEMEYDAASNVLLTTNRMRWDNATGTGPLQGPSSAQPKSRDSYVATWYDGVGRGVASANYGTNAEAGLPERPESAPASSDGVLVSLIAYNARGEAFETVDPAGQVTRTYSDDAGRAVRTITNYVAAFAPACFCPGAEENVVVEFEIGPGGLLAKLIAFNADTGNQVTRYQYGVGPDASDLTSNRLLLAEIPPNAADSSDRVTYAYNRQGQTKQMTDDNGSVHGYTFDGLGRQTADTVTTLADGVDGAVRRIGRNYEVRGMVENVTSYSDAAGTTIANQVQNVYNDFAQLAVQYQEHDGAVNTGTTPKAQYGYADGSANTIRPTSMTYPSGHVLEYQYSGDDANKLSRLNILHAADEDLAGYGYLGLGVFIRTDYLPPGIRYDLATGTGANRYAGLDRFGRIIDMEWKKVASASSSSSSESESSLVHLKYGYDRASNRTYRQDLAAQSYGKNFDELYEYDGLDQLKKFHRGQLTNENTVIESPGLQQSWKFDATGNWKNFTTFDPTDATKTLDQRRQHNKFNQITGISRTVGSAWATPTFDRNGNMLTDEKGQQYRYDAWNRLVEVRDGEGAVIAEYQYDGQRRRIGETPGDEMRDLYYSRQWQVLEEQVGGDVTARYVWSPVYVDAMILRDRASTTPGTLDERLWVLQDTNFNVVTLADNGGTVVERFAYDPFGVRTVYSPDYLTVRTDGSDYDFQYGFQGFRYDPVSGLYFPQLRPYSPTLGRPIQVDMLRFSAGDVNFYRWEGNSPVNLTDPTGLVVTTAKISLANYFLEFYSQIYYANSKVPIRTDHPIIDAIKDLGRNAKLTLAKAMYGIIKALGDKTIEITADTETSCGCCKFTGKPSASISGFLGDGNKIKLKLPKLPYIDETNFEIEFKITSNTVRNCKPPGNKDDEMELKIDATIRFGIAGLNAPLNLQSEARYRMTCGSEGQELKPGWKHVVRQPGDKGPVIPIPFDDISKLPEPKEFVFPPDPSPM
jgi:RHS repeat-associated protein